MLLFFSWVITLTNSGVHTNHTSSLGLRGKKFGTQLIWKISQTHIFFTEEHRKHIKCSSCENAHFETILSQFKFDGSNTLKTRICAKKVDVLKINNWRKVWHLIRLSGKSVMWLGVYIFTFRSKDLQRFTNLHLQIMEELLLAAFLFTRGLCSR